MSILEEITDKHWNNLDWISILRWDVTSSDCIWMLKCVCHWLLIRFFRIWRSSTPDRNLKYIKIRTSPDSLSNNPDVCQKIPKSVNKSSCSSFKSFKSWNPVLLMEKAPFSLKNKLCVSCLVTCFFQVWTHVSTSFSGYLCQTVIKFSSLKTHYFFCASFSFVESNDAVVQKQTQIFIKTENRLLTLSAPENLKRMIQNNIF